VQKVFRGFYAINAELPFLDKIKVPKPEALRIENQRSFNPFAGLGYTKTPASDSEAGVFS
jgi:hypothetical protein